MKLFILALLLGTSFSLGIAGMAAPEAARSEEEIERKVMDMDGDGRDDLVRMYEAPTDDPAVDQRCLQITLAKAFGEWTNCKALLAQRGSTLASHEYRAEPGKLTFTHHRESPQRTTETEVYVWDEARRDFHLKEVRQAFYNAGNDNDPAMVCWYRNRHLPRYAYLSRMNREQLYIVLRSAGIAKKACSPHQPPALSPGITRSVF
jgi:hypothetical protein